jgi:hypothetical protein
VNKKKKLEFRILAKKKRSDLRFKLFIIRIPLLPSILKLKLGKSTMKEMEGGKSRSLRGKRKNWSL